MNTDPADFAPIPFTPIVRDWQKPRTELPTVIDKRIIENEHGCWIWQATVRGGNLSHSYGQAWWGGKSEPAHRFVYERLIGDIPDGLILDHLCMVKPCVNPEHLEPATRNTNMQRWADAEREDRERRSQELWLNRES